MVIGISLFVICLYLEMRTSNNYIAGVFTLFLGGMGTYIICIVSCIIECKLPGISNKLSAIGKMTLPIYLMDKYFVALFSKAIDAIGLINPLSIVMSCFVFETIILGGITHYVFRKNKILRIISGC